MYKKSKIISIPSGFEYFSIHKTQKISEYKKKIQNLLEQRGMIEFLPPLLDYIDTFLLTSQTFINGNSEIPGKLFELKDSNGEILTIRPDLTVMAMKSFLYHYPQIDKVQYYYIQPVYRDIKKGSGITREIYQAGVEWIGKYEDRIVQLISLSNELLNLFPYKFVYVFSNSRFIKELLNYFPEKIHKEILTYLYYKDIFRIEEFCKENQISDPLKNILLELPLLIGDRSIIKEYQLLLKNYSHLFEIIYNTYSTIQKIQNLDNSITIVYDFSSLKEFNYYTDITFEVYTNNTKALVGGIYDNFSLKLSSIQIPSCGFALNLSELINKEAEL